MPDRDALRKLQVGLSTAVLAVLGYVTFVGPFPNANVVVVTLVLATALVFLYLEFSSGGEG